MKRNPATPTVLNTEFANALRECLGLGPLYQETGRDKRPDDMTRFYRTWPQDRPGYSNGRRNTQL